MTHFGATTLNDWFEVTQQIGLTNRTRVALAGEGVNDPSDLVDFKDLDTVCANICKPHKIIGYRTADNRTNQLHGILVNT